MQLPQINTLRMKEFKLNGKTITLRPWTNLQLTNFDSVYSSSDEYKFNLIKKYLIDSNIECNVPLTIIEEKVILTELYKLSKSNLLDVIFTCNECESKTTYTINLEKTVTYQSLKARIIKTKDCIFNLRQNSTYRMDLNNEITFETLKYLSSFVDSFDYKDKTFEVTDIDEFASWLNTELDKPNFDQLITEFDKIQNKIDINVNGICEFCGHSQKLDFKGVEDFLE